MATEKSAVKIADTILRGLYEQEVAERHPIQVPRGLQMKNSDGSFQVSSIEFSFKEWAAGYRAALARSQPQGEPVAKEKIAPVQGYVQGIPWSLHLEAYNAYCNRYSPQPALIDLEGRGCRGGFSTGELDVFIPGWRDKLSELGRLKARIAELESALRTSHQEGK